MGKFKYSMQNILDIKIKLETQAKNEFSEANRAYLIEKEKLEELFKKRAVYEAALKEQLSGSLNISEINICKKNIESHSQATGTAHNRICTAGQACGRTPQHVSWA